nr:retrovirus-related Pol polyprotein from transposon TNT 1-94 [Tanacetum cinerariifolium]
MEDTMLELVKIRLQKELLCIYDNVNDLIESALNTKLLSINSQRLDKKEQEVNNVVEQPAERGNRSIESLQNFRVIHKSSNSLKNTSQISSIHAVALILSTKEPKYSPSMGYEHSNTTLETESDEIIKSGVEELVQILSENEVTLEDKRECDMPVCEDSSTFDVCDDHSDIFSDSKDDDDILSNDDDFKDIKYVEASLSDPEIDSVEEENVVHQEEEESDNSLSDNFSPELETFYDHTKETRSGNTTTHANGSLPEYDSFCFEIEPDQERLINLVKSNIFDDSSNDPLLEEAYLFLAFDNRYHRDNPSVPLPPSEPPDEEFDLGDEISVVIDKLEGQFCDSNLEVAFRRNACFIRNLEGVVRTPQQNGVVERRNRTLVEAARTMLIFSRAPLFLWAEAIATACFTQNRSIIHCRFNKTPYELINGRKPDISFLHVFGALCYPKNDREDIGKLGAKGDIGFFIGYFADSCAYRVYNRRTKKIMETMNVSFDELSAMAFEQSSSKPELNSMTSGHISSGLDLTYAPSTITTQQPSEGELDLLFEAMYDDYFCGQPSATVRTVPPAQEP